MILLCELSFVSRAHVPFNAGLLATIHAAFPKEGLTFFGGRTHIEELKKEVSQTLARAIVWREIVPPPSDASYWQRFWCEVRILRQLLGVLSTDAQARLVLTSAYPSTVLALKIARFFSQTHKTVQVVLHGMSGVVGRRSKRPLVRLQDTKTALTLLGNRQIHYIVLEQAIREAVATHFPALSEKIDALEHPLSPNQAELPSISLSEPIRFGFLGLADRAKGFHVFLDAADRVTAKYGNGVEFHAVGHFPKRSMTSFKANVLVTKPQATLMSRDAFLDAVAPLHFIILPHEPSAYTLTASGVLLDAIAWAKPVICRKIPIFESIFKQHGDIGYLFDNDEALTNVIERIVEGADNSRYQRQVSNLRGAQKARHPEALAEQYRYICLRADSQ